MSGSVDIEQYKIKTEPYYESVGNELELYSSAYEVRMPMMIKGPTGCGKSRFVEYMAWKLGKPLITVACNEDMTASDLVGRFLLDKEGTKWQDGPLTTAARIGAICYLDEVVEARQDTTVVIHPLTDHRRTLPLDKKGELIKAHADFQLVISYNPGYQSLMKDLKQSTKQRFGGLDFDYPEEGRSQAVYQTAFRRPRLRLSRRGDRDSDCIEGIRCRRGDRKKAGPDCSSGT
jgi:nitric oxide reductase NorQ protein